MGWKAVPVCSRTISPLLTKNRWEIYKIHLIYGGRVAEGVHLHPICLANRAFGAVQVSRPHLKILRLLAIGGFDMGSTSARPTQPPNICATFSFPMRMFQ